MRSHSVLLILSCCFLASCGDKAINNQASSPELPASSNPNTGSVSLPVLAETPAIAGSGCPAGSAQVELQPQSASIKLRFNDLVIGTGQDQNGNITCNLAIPVTVPNGYQVSLIPLHFTGNLSGNGLTIELRRAYFFAGSIGASQVSSLALPTDSQFSISDSVNPEDTLQWSNCGQDTNIRVNLRLRIKGGEGQANLKISSTDKAEPTLFKLNYRVCQ
ncbi:DUF4360 domain-containing protein [uncultured Thiothrix sp.]|jgi:hypothetical protein|uniref:DUF4360 domain-containing protein n=1 Tax=uncultured Thiothrix sp. TaxID=223185 RepID=UPI00260E79D4|nr:DUF4360 domain-containing protein [uncultured Thiothrix sp.]HMT92360.1 DUF4360 domain-containing protein [Thiolinea sp.]